MYYAFSIRNLESIGVLSRLKYKYYIRLGSREVDLWKPVNIENTLMIFLVLAVGIISGLLVATLENASIKRNIENINQFIKITLSSTVPLEGEITGSYRYHIYRFAIFKKPYSQL